MMHMDRLQGKRDALAKCLSGYGRAVIAFSGGIDSMLLLRAACEFMGEGNVFAAIVDSQFVERSGIDRAKAFCESIGVGYEVVEMDALAIDELRGNSRERCYVCKKGIFERALSVAHDMGFDAVLEGSNVDDLSDFRPGMRAIEELGIKSPFLEARLGKEDIRLLAREMGIAHWNMPSSPCLATRFVFGEELSEGRLKMVEEAERRLQKLGFDSTRVRVHGEGDKPLARIEVAEEDLALFADPSLRNKVYEQLTDLGFSFVSVDIQGYRRGNMNA